MIMYVKNNFESPRYVNGQNLIMQDPNTLMNKRKPSTLSGSSDGISIESYNESENSFINKVKGKWGDEESELRQAIYF